MVDFGTSKVVTIIAQSSKTERSEIIGTGSVLYDGFRDGDWNTPEKLVESVKNSIAAAELQARQSVREVYVGVPGEYVKVFTDEAEVPITGPDGTVSAEDIDAVHDAVADRLNLIGMDGIVLHRSPAWFSVDDGKTMLLPFGQHGSRLRGKISYILADRQFMNDIAELMGMLNITVAGYLSSSLGTALLMVPPEERDRTAVLIDMGYLNTEINVVEGETIIYHKVLDVGGSELTVALAEEEGLSLKDAERIKRGFSFQPDEFEAQEDIEIRDPYTGRREMIPRRHVRSIMQAAMQDLTDRIRDEMDGDPENEREKRRRNDRDSGVFALISQRSRIYLTGGGIAMMKGGRNELSEALGVAVESVTNKTSKLNYPMFSSALGLTNLVFDALQVEEERESSGGAFSGVKNLFRKK